MSATVIALFPIGLVFLVAGAEFVVRGGSRLAAALGISPLVVGLTVVAFGTSAPELAVSVESALIGRADIALGNVVGSNIFNVLFILGVSALITPLIVSQQLVRVDVPVMVGVSLVLLLFALDGKILPYEGAILFGGIVAYTLFLLLQSRASVVVQSGSGVFSAPPSEPVRVVRNVMWIAAGLILLVVGSGWLVNGAVALATTFGVSELVIGLTVVAAGTSLPEVATSIVASIRGERDIAVGNVVGSNIFNILAVLGLSALVAPVGLAVAPSALTFDIPVMIAVALACLPIFFTGHRIARWEGALFLGYYVLYTVYLILHAARHPVLPAFGAAMALFILPLTAITVLVLSARAYRRHRQLPRPSDSG